MATSGGLPPVPDLIPIALLKAPGGGADVMGEQRPRRRRPQPAPVDSGAARPRRARPDRHRKADSGRREHHRRRAADRDRTECRDTSTERPANPRVNPIFVWIRQEDTRIVDVKCEDYDKRNRILLTKTAQGWRAIPRTETLAPPLREAADRHHHRHRKARTKPKVRKKSTAVQVDDHTSPRPPTPKSPITWTVPVNVESHLPSHKIPITNPGKNDDYDEDSVNSAVDPSAQTPEQKCKMPCDVTPLDNLLAVAEFEFNQHMQSGEWDKSRHHQDDDDDDDQKDFITNMEHLNSLIESCSKSDPSKAFDDEPKSDCDYTEDDDNNLAMDDILSRLEQSLRSPDPSEGHLNYDEDDGKDDVNKDNFDENTGSFKSVPDIENYLTTSQSSEVKANTQINPSEDLIPPITDLEIPSSPQIDHDNDEEIVKKPDEVDDLSMIESSTVSREMVENEEPTDLSVHHHTSKFVANCVSSNSPDEVVMEGPTDLSVPKAISGDDNGPRPPSQNSEAIQSPQPSGIPAVPPSPDIVSTSANAFSSLQTKSNQKSSVFLESLLANSTQKIALNSEVTITRQKEPLDLGKCRKSASPTVTCSSEEVKNNNADFEPPPSKKSKPDDITLKNLLEVESSKSSMLNESKPVEVVKSSSVQETPKLLELLKTDASGPDPLRQLRQILYDSNLNVPDPMLVPKEKLSQIISNPGVEIPKLLKQRPELRLPEALAFPHLLQDPDILVITLQQLETIILKQNQAFNFKDLKLNEEKIYEKPNKKPEKPIEIVKEPQQIKKSNKDESLRSKPESKSGNFNELANDIDAATAAAFNQMIWLPYLNQLEAMSFGSNPEMLKMLSSAPAAMYPNQVPDLNHLIGRFPPPLSFPMQQSPVNYNNPLEMSMWQEAMMQANMLRPKLPFDGLNPNSKNASFRDYLDKLNFATPGKSSSSSSAAAMANAHKMNVISKANMFPSSSSENNGRSGYHNFLNIPNAFQQQQQQQQQNNSKQNLQIPHYNPLFHQQKNFGHQQQQKQSTMNPFMKAGTKSSYANFYHHHQQQQQQQQQQLQNHQRSMMVEDKQSYYHHQNSSKHHHHQQEQRPKLACKSFANLSHHQQHQQQKHHQHHQEQQHHHKEKNEFTGKNHQPIDLSGSTLPTTKLKVKEHLIDPVNAPKLLKHDDVAEVGSTTASIEEMQDAHKHLWHPLFGNQKGYHSPWNWTTVTATGE